MKKLVKVTQDNFSYDGCMFFKGDLVVVRSEDLKSLTGSVELIVENKPIEGVKIASAPVTPIKPLEGEKK